MFSRCVTDVTAAVTTGTGPVPAQPVPVHPQRNGFNKAGSGAEVEQCDGFFWRLDRKLRHALVEMAQCDLPAALKQAGAALAEERQ